MNRLEQARALWEERKRTHGEDALPTLKAMEGLIDILRGDDATDENRYEGALLQEKLASLKAKRWGNQEKTTVRAWNMAAVLWYEAKDLKRAYRAIRQALAGAEAAFGQTHPERQRIMNNYAVILSAMERYREKLRVDEALWKPWRF